MNVLETLKICSSTDYSKFKLRSKTNRAIDNTNQRNIKNSIIKYGFSVTGFIIVVEDPKDGLYEIIEGQHRFVSFKELNMPVIFAVIPENSLSIEIDLAPEEGQPAYKMSTMPSETVMEGTNTASRKWVTRDFIQHNAVTNESIDFATMITKKHGYSAPFANALLDEVGMVVVPLNNKNIRDNTVEIDFKDEEKVKTLESLLQQLKTFKAEFPHHQLKYIKEPILRAFLECYSNHNFDFDALMETVAETPEIIGQVKGNMENRVQMAKAHNKTIKSAKHKISVNTNHKGRKKGLMFL